MINKLFSRERKKKQQCVKISFCLQFIPFLSIEQSTKKNATFPGPTNSCSCVFFHPLWHFPVCLLDLALREALEERLGCQKHIQSDSEAGLLCFRLSTQQQTGSSTSAINLYDKPMILCRTERLPVVTCSFPSFWPTILANEPEER